MANEDRFKKFLLHALSHIENDKIEFNPDIPYTVTLSNGNSSPSFGIVQNDVAGNGTAKRAFKQIINNSVGKVEELDQKKADRIIELASIRGDDRSDDDTIELKSYFPIINNALSSKEDIDPKNPDINNRTLVDQADMVNFEEAFNAVKNTIETARTRPNGAGDLTENAEDPRYLTELIAWKNQHGNLSGSKAHITNVDAVTTKAYNNYLNTQSYFKSHPNFTKEFPDRVTNATNYALKQTGIKFTEIAPDKDGNITVTPDQLNWQGANTAAIYKNEAGKPTGRVWAFPKADSVETAGDLTLTTSKETSTFKNGKWAAVDVAADGSHKIDYNAARGNDISKFAKEPDFFVTPHSDFSAVLSQFKASGISLHQSEKLPTKHDIKEIVQNLNAKFAETTKQAGSNPDIPNIRNDQPRQAAPKGHNI